MTSPIVPYGCWLFISMNNLLNIPYISTPFCLNYQALLLVILIYPLLAWDSTQPGTESEARPKDLSGSLKNIPLVDGW